MLLQFLRDGVDIRLNLAVVRFDFLRLVCASSEQRLQALFFRRVALEVSDQFGQRLADLVDISGAYVLQGGL